MAVSAQPDVDDAEPAIAEVDLRGRPDVRAGTFPWDGPDLPGGWHRHPYHQVEYALEGVAEVETSAGRYLLPRHQAIWIPAGLAHETTLRGVRSIAAFFDPAVVPAPDDRARVLAAAPVIREMLVYGLRWPITRTTLDPAADTFFDALALVVTDRLRHEAPLHLPTSSDPLLAAVMDFTNRHLTDVTSATVCQAVGLSERTLRRRFSATGMSWSAYLLQSRVLRAMALLADGDRRVIEVSTAVGFESPSAFARAFRKVSGESPLEHQRRVRLP